MCIGVIGGYPDGWVRKQVPCSGAPIVAALDCGVRFPIEKMGTTGAVLAALACPICFPKLALVGTALGLGFLAPYETYIAFGIQALFVLALIGQVFAYRTHGNRWLLGLAICTTALLFVAYYAVSSSVLLQLALVGLVAGSLWQVLEMRRCAKCQAESAR